MKKSLLLFALLLLISGAMFGQEADPTLTVTPTSLSNFTYPQGAGPSNPQNASVSGTNLAADVVVNAPDHYEVCTSQNGNFSQSITLTPHDGTLENAAIYVRLKAGLDVGDYNEELTVTCDNLTRTIALSGNVTSMPTVATPVFSPAGGSYPSPQNVTITCATSGATIRYTLDGTEPTESSTIYTTSLTINETTTIKAKAWKNGYQPSSIAETTYTINIPDPTLTVTPTSLSNFTYPQGAGPSNPQNASVSGTNLAADVVVNAPDHYEVCTSQNGNFSQSITLTPHDGTLENAAIYVRLKAGLDVGDYNEELTVTCDNLTRTIALSGNVTSMPTVATPVFSPAGGSYPSPQNVTITCATSGATIRYTLDGTEPTESSTIYTTSLTINETTTIKAKAWKNGYQPSSIAEATYTIIYTITVSANPSNGGTVTGGGTYEAGQPCTVSATANTGYTFTNWTENGSVVSTSANYTFNVTSNRNLVANFQQQTQQYTISVSANPTNGGTVSGGGTYAAGQSCTVSATANTGYVFINWRENGTVVSTSANYTFTVTGNRTLVAHFIRTYTINVSANPSNGGPVTGGGTYQQGQSCTVSATANNGYVFTNWTENGNVVSTSANYTFTVNGNRTLVAHFNRLYTITVSANPTDGGTVSGGGSYQQGQSCTVVATAADGYTFSNWTENGNVVNTNANYTFVVNGNRTLVANFTLLPPDTYNINVSANPSDGGTVTGGGTYSEGESCTVSATANTGYAFVNWTEGGNVVSEDASYTFTVTGNRTLVANFQANSYTITVKPDPQEGGTVSGGGTYQQGQSCTVNAEANSGYTFINWTEDGNHVSDDPSYTFTVTGDRILVAHFEEQQQQYTITTNVTPTNSGTVTGGGTYYSGDTCILNAIPAQGYQFEQWKTNGQHVSNEPTYSFVVTGNATYTAYFRQTSGTYYTITLLANPVEGGTVTGGGTYLEGSTCRAHATANPGYTFTNWTENGNIVSTSANLNFTVNGNRTLEANFVQEQPEQYMITVNEPTEGGTVTVDQNEATPGTIITITVNSDDGYELETLSVYKTNDPSQQVTVTNNQFSMPAYDVTVMAKFKPIGIHIDTPDPICAGESLDLTEPSIPWPLHGEWQLSETYDFEQPIPYSTGQTLEANYDGWYLRYHAYNQFIGNTYSNKVQITVRSLDGFVLQGNTSANLNQEVEYQVYIDGVDDYADYSFNWSVSDAQAVTTITANSLKVIWKTIGQHQVSVTVTDNIAGCTDTFSINITVTGCIENIQAILPKYHKEDYEYILILVYPNVDNEGNPSNEEYDYQWQYSPDGVQDYLDLDEGTSKNQYYYIGGPLKDGYYKVRINRKGEDECFGETEAYPVFNNRQLRIYPNPSRRGSEIMVMNDCNGPALLTIYSTDGRVLHTQTVTDSQATIGINLPQGVYVAYLTNRDGYTKVGKLIIH